MASETSPKWPTNSVIQRPNGVVAVEWADADLTDAVLEQFATTRLPTLLGGLPKDSKKTVECTVNLAGNRLQKGQGIGVLLRKLRACAVHVTVLRLYKNQLGDHAARVLAEHIREAAAAHMPLMQLHLSNNELTEVGIKALIEAAHKCGGYPRWDAKSNPLPSLGSGDSRRHALWLRPEQQKIPIDDPQRFIDRCEEEGYAVCFMSSRDEAVPAEVIVQMHPSFIGITEYPSGQHKGKGKAKAKEKGDTYGGDRGEMHFVKGASGKWGGNVDGKSVDTKGCKGYESKGKGKGNSGKGKGKSEADLRKEESLKWLDERKSRPGREGVEFNDAWRAWCSENRLSEASKAERFESIANFRKYYEDQQSQAEEKNDEAQRALSLQPAAVSEVERGPLLCPGAPTDKSTLAVESAKLATSEAPPTPAQVTTNTVFSRKVSYLRDSLAHIGAQHQSELLGQVLNLDLTEASKKPEWRQLATEGTRQLGAGCKERIRIAGGSLLTSEDCSVIRETCASRAALAAVFRHLSLEKLLTGRSVPIQLNDEVCADALAVVYASLAGEDSDIAQQLLDFVFLSGIGRTFNTLALDTSEQSAAGAPAEVSVSSSATVAAAAARDAYDVDDDHPDLDAIAATFGVNFDSSSATALSACGGATYAAGVEDAGGDRNEDEVAARQRRVDQRKRRGEARWNYSGVPAKERAPDDHEPPLPNLSVTSSVHSAAINRPETNEQAMLRLLGQGRTQARHSQRDGLAPHQGPSWEVGPPPPADHRYPEVS